MKAMTLFLVFSALALCHVCAQVVKDPLLDYYNRNFSKADLAAARDPESPSPPITPQTKIYCFEANFTGPGRKSVFITDEGESLGAHGKYAWSIYCPVKSSGYQLVSDESDFITGGLGGPGYIGYVAQIKRYGIVTGAKDSVSVDYLDNGTIKSQSIDEKRGHADAEHYPKYFGNGPPNYHVTTYTVAQLAQKYANPDSTNVITPAAQ